MRRRRNVIWLVAISIVLLSGRALAQSDAASSEQEPPTADLLAKEPTAIYTNTVYGFTLQYPQSLTPQPGSGDWSMASVFSDNPADGTPVVSISVVSIDRNSERPFPYPLFFEAYTLVGVSTDVAHCYASSDGPTGPEPPADVSIGGLAFKKVTMEDAGMMKYRVAVSYRIIHDNRCFSVEQNEFGSDYRDETTLPGLTDDQLDALYQEAGTIARSIRFFQGTAPAQPVPSDADALTFRAGATRIVQTGTIGAHALKSFTTGASEGQFIQIQASGQATSAPALIVTSLPDGAPLQTASAKSASFMTILRKNQNFLIQLANGPAAQRYSLIVTVPATIVFASDLQEGFFAGTTPPGDPVDCAFRVQKGQQVVIARRTGVGSGSSLIVRGPYAETSAVAAAAATPVAAPPTAVPTTWQLTSANNFSFRAPADGLYVLTLIPPSGVSVPYSIILQYTW